MKPLYSSYAKPLLYTSRLIDLPKKKSYLIVDI